MAKLGTLPNEMVLVTKLGNQSFILFCLLAHSNRVPLIDCHSHTFPFEVISGVQNLSLRSLLFPVQVCGNDRIQHGVEVNPLPKPGYKKLKLTLVVFLKKVCYVEEGGTVSAAN